MTENKIVMLLTPEEARQVERSRQDAEFRRIRAEQRENCTHKFRFIGHGHNDKAYECIHCGKTEYL